MFRKGRQIALRFFCPPPQAGELAALGPGNERFVRRDASLAINPLIEVAQDTRRNPPDVTVPVRNFIIVTDDPVPVATLAPVIFRPHQVFQGHFEDVGDFGPVGCQLKIRRYARNHWQNAKAAEGQIKVEIPERLDQYGREADLLLGLTQRGPSRRLLAVDLAARKGDLAGIARQNGGALGQKYRPRPTVQHPDKYSPPPCRDPPRLSPRLPVPIPT